MHNLRRVYSLLITIIVLAGCKQGPKISRQNLANRHIPFSEEQFAEQAGAGNKDIIKLFFDTGMELNTGKNRQYHPLIQAIYWNRREIVNMLLKHEADPGDALVAASKEGKTEIVKTVLENNSDIPPSVRQKALLRAIYYSSHSDIADLISETGINSSEIPDINTWLLSAIRNRKPEAVKAYLDMGANPNAKTSRDLPALNIAMKKGYPDITNILLKAGAKYNIDGETLTAAAQAGYVKIVKEILATKPQIIREGRKGYRLFYKYGSLALTNASEGGYDSVIQVLLNNDADLNPETPGMTPLMAASANGQKSTVKLLLRRGGNINAHYHDAVGESNKPCYTPLAFALSNRHSHIVKILINAGSKYRFNSYAYGTPHHSANNCEAPATFIAAAQGGFTQILKEMIDSGASKNINIGIGYGYTTAIQVAAPHGHIETIELLLNHGINLSNGNYDHYTALGLAAEKGKLEVVKLLYKSGADISGRSNSSNSHSALGLAAANNHSQIVDFILEPDI